MKKIIVLLLMLAVVCSACSGKASDSGSTPTTSEETSAVFAATEALNVQQNGTELHTETVTEEETAEQSTTEASFAVTQTERAAEATEKTSAVPSTQATTKPTTTKPSTTKQATTKPSTLPSATSAAQEKCAVILGVNSVRFGCTQEQIISAFGSPGDTVTETTTDGTQIKSLIYTSNYKRFSVFQLRNGALAAFYTVADDAIVTDGESSYSLNAGGSEEFGKLSVAVYTEPSGKTYAFYAKHGGFSYTPNKLTSCEGQETLIFHTTNALRAINGIGALERSAKADDCIRLHCKDMAENNYLAHQSLDGRQPHERAEDAGIGYRSCGENLYGGNSLVFAVVDGWYNSSGHRKNILDRDYEYIGIATVRAGGEYAVYSGQLFYSD